MTARHDEWFRAADKGSPGLPVLGQSLQLSPAVFHTLGIRLQVASPDKVSRRDIYIAGLFPFSGSEGHVGNGVKPAVDLALEHINNDSRILPHFNLKISYNDTKCPDEDAIRSQ
nr:hypothetical protein BaRGS_006356 [Batillaria attramentaria]